jgi:hypothetical protein
LSNEDSWGYRIGDMGRCFTLIVCICALALDGCEYGNIGRLTRRCRRLEAKVHKLERQVSDVRDQIRQQ